MSPKDKTRLIQLLGMLGSDFDNERATAGRMANDIVKANKLSWDELLNEKPLIVINKQEQNYNSWRAKARRCIDDYPEEMTDWESEFMHSILVRGFATLTPRQEEVLERIYNKLFS